MRYWLLIALLVSLPALAIDQVCKGDNCVQVGINEGTIIIKTTAGDIKVGLNEAKVESMLRQIKTELVKEQERLARTNRNNASSENQKIQTKLDEVSRKLNNPDQTIVELLDSIIKKILDLEQKLTHDNHSEIRRQQEEWATQEANLLTLLVELVIRTPVVPQKETAAKTLSPPKYYLGAQARLAFNNRETALKNFGLSGEYFLPIGWGQLSFEVAYVRWDWLEYHDDKTLSADTQLEYKNDNRLQLYTMGLKFAQEPRRFPFIGKKGFFYIQALTGWSYDPDYDRTERHSSRPYQSYAAGYTLVDSRPIAVVELSYSVIKLDDRQESFNPFGNANIHYSENSVETIMLGFRWYVWGWG